MHKIVGAHRTVFSSLPVSQFYRQRFGLHAIMASFSIFTSSEASAAKKTLDFSFFVVQ